MTELRATLRLQFHVGFTFDNALPWLDYFADLGISHLYASPIFHARPGSRHGYDIVDPTEINPELGGEASLRRLVEALHLRGMGLILDIVPNHMGIGGGANPWWQDVLEWGPASPYAEFFDIRWRSHDLILYNRVLLPFLCSDYGEVLSNGEIALYFDAVGGRFQVCYNEQRFPLYPASYAPLLEAAGTPELYRLSQTFNALDNHRDEAATLHQQLAELAATEPQKRAIETALAAFRGNKDTALERLHRLLEHQHYKLTSWRTAADDINWRRFFDINELVSLRVERGEVFEATHGKLFQLIEDGLLDGVRIDHVDGLANPRAYCRRLQRRSKNILRSDATPISLHVEKILGTDEHLPEDWQCDGSTGYDFMNQLSLLQHDPCGKQPLRALWNHVSGRPEDFAEEIHQARRLVLTSSLSSDLKHLVQNLLQVARADPASRDLTVGNIHRALFQLLVHFPVYRTYAGAGGRSIQDQRYFQAALEAAHGALDETDHAVLKHLDRWLGGEPLRHLPPGPLRRLRGETLTRFQQLSSPIAAKAVEDTACYRSATLLSRNDVGFDPQRFAAPPDAFHSACQKRLANFPQTLLASATHDHKRGEDSRARLAVISEVAPWFTHNVEHWLHLAIPLRQMQSDGPAPSPGDELILFQSLLSSWPLDAPCDGTPLSDEYRQRLLEWQRKAVREAKLRSRWEAPNEAYEQACTNYLEQLLQAPTAQTLRRSLGNAAARLMPPGALNGLAQCLLRLTCPGIPDIYQGCEGWDFSLVDPDNRRPVDFAQRAAALVNPLPLPKLLANWRDGRIKQALIARVLGLRKIQPGLFRDGNYLPLETLGEHADKVLAFARCSRNGCLITVIPRLIASLLNREERPIVPSSAWSDTRLALPSALAGYTYNGLFSSRPLPNDEYLSISEVLADFPVNLLYQLAPAGPAGPAGPSAASLTSARRRI